jgi:hypothetical protein
MGTPSQTDQEEATGSGSDQNTDSNGGNNALSEDEQLTRWAALQIAANDIALAHRRRTLRKVE